MTAWTSDPAGMSRAPTGLATPEVAGQIARRHRIGRAWLAVFQLSTIVGIVVLGALLYNIVNEAAGYVAYEHRTDPAEVLPAGRTVADLAAPELAAVLTANLSRNAVATIERERPLAERDRADLARLVHERVLETRAARTWNLTESVLDRPAIAAEAAGRTTGADLRLTSWLSPAFITAPQSGEAEYAGIRTAILGSLWIIVITMLVAVPIGVAAGVYLEEYADRGRWINRAIQTNISNLAGVPSIIYGMLGLAVFVRALEPLTSGGALGAADPTTANGRTILSAALTMALLILPLIIINAQEAIRAVPSSLREASFGLGATRWQTIRHHVLPGAVPGILTGTILAMSRAIGETAPLIVVGMSTYITFDPSSPFDKFTTLPGQVYQWTSRPQPEFHHIAAAASVVLLVLLVALNASAIYGRNRAQVRY